MNTEKVKANGKKDSPPVSKTFKNQDKIDSGEQSEDFQAKLQENVTHRIAKGYGSKPEHVGMPSEPKQYEGFLSSDTRDLNQGPQYLKGLWQQIREGTLTDSTRELIKKHCAEIGLDGATFDRISLRNSGNVEHLAWLK